MAELTRRRDRDWEVLRLSSDELAVDLVPGFGGTIVSVRRLSDDAELLHRTPWGLRARGALSVPGTSEAVMWDRSPGGWQTLFPNAGDSVSVHGTEWGYHGEARLCWMDWTFTGASVQLSGRLTRAPFEVAKVVSLRGGELTVGETVRNIGTGSMEVMWGQQLMFGGSLLGPDSVVDSGATVVRPDPQVSRGASYDDLMPWPRALADEAVLNLRSVPAGDAGETRVAYLSGFSEPSFTIRRPARGLVATVEWDGDAWPHAWYHLEAGGRRDYPWYGTGYFLALTPCTSWPGHGLHDARRVSGSALTIEAGRARSSFVSLRVG